MELDSKRHTDVLEVVLEPIRPILSAAHRLRLEPLRFVGVRVYDVGIVTDPHKVLIINTVVLLHVDDGVLAVDEVLVLPHLQSPLLSVGQVP